MGDSYAACMALPLLSPRLAKARNALILALEAYEKALLAELSDVRHAMQKTLSEKLPKVRKAVFKRPLPRVKSKARSVWVDDGKIETLKQEISRLHSAGSSDIEIAALLGKSVATGQPFKPATIRRLRKEIGLPGLWGRPKNDFHGSKDLSGPKTGTVKPDDHLHPEKWDKLQQA